MTIEQIAVEQAQERTPEQKRTHLGAPIPTVTPEQLKSLGAPIPTVPTEFVGKHVYANDDLQFSDMVKLGVRRAFTSPGIIAVSTPLTIWGGAKAGAKAGAAVGSVVAPGAGTVAGSILGGIAGFLLPTAIMTGIGIKSVGSSEYERKKAKGDTHYSESMMTPAQKGMSEGFSFGAIRYNDASPTARTIAELYRTVLMASAFTPVMPASVTATAPKAVLSGLPYATAFGVGDGLQKYNESIGAGREREDAIKLGLISGASSFGASTLFFSVAPAALSRVISRDVRSKALFSTLEAGARFTGYSEGSRVIGNLTGQAFNSMSETPVYESVGFKAGDAVGSFIGGMMFAGVLKSGGACISAIGRKLIKEPIQDRFAKNMAEKDIGENIFGDKFFKIPSEKIDEIKVKIINDLQGNTSGSRIQHWIRNNLDSKFWRKDNIRAIYESVGTDPTSFTGAI